MSSTMVTITGNLVSDVAFRVTARGEPMASFRVAATASRFDRSANRWVDTDTVYVTVTAWRRAAENARTSLSRGLPVVVHGRLRQRIVDRPVPGVADLTVPVTYTDLDAVSFGLDLSRCRARYERAPVGPQTGPAGPGEPGPGDGHEAPGGAPGGGDPAPHPGPGAAGPERPAA